MKIFRHRRSLRPPSPTSPPRSSGARSSRAAWPRSSNPSAPCLPCGAPSSSSRSTRTSGRADTPSYIYIVDANGRLSGVAPLRALLMARPQDSVHSIMVKNVTRLRSSAPLSEITAMFQQYHFVSLPVADDKDRLIGIVSVNAMKEALQQEQDQVLRGITGVDPRERLKQTLAAIRGRLPWITVTILGGLGC